MVAYGEALKRAAEESPFDPRAYLDYEALKALLSVWKSKFYGAFSTPFDATPARWRGGAGSSPLDRARTAAFSPRNDLVKNFRAPDALVDFHTGYRRSFR